MSQGDNYIKATRAWIGAQVKSIEHDEHLIISLEKEIELKKQVVELEKIQVAFKKQQLREVEHNLNQYVNHQTNNNEQQ